MRCGVVGCGVVWWDAMWCGVVRWDGMRCGVVWCGVVWCGGMGCDVGSFFFNNFINMIY